MPRHFTFFFFLLFLPLRHLQATPPASKARVASPSPEHTLEFVENRGQWDSKALYMAELPAAGGLFLTRTGFTYTFLAPADLRAHSHHHESGAAAALRPDPTPSTLHGHAYSMTFEGGSARAQLQAEEPTSGTRNYFRGSDSKHWASQVRGFRAIRYSDVYPGIGVHLYENTNRQLEYDFTLAAGAKPSAIRLRYDGMTSLRLTSDGHLLIQTSVGEVTEQAPKAWQVAANGQRIPISCRFELHKQVVQFKLGEYNPRLPLVIDPTVLFSSFTGSTADNWGFTATYDQQGNMYSGGVAFSAGYPSSIGAFQTSFAGAVDVAIIKYKTTITGPAARLYATYLGGNSTEAPHSLVVNGRDELVILGSTSSPNFPVTSSAVQPKYLGGPATGTLGGVDVNSMGYPNGSDLFVATLSSTGSQLVASTYLGGSGNDGLNLSLVNNYGDQFRGDVITDGDNNVYLVSTTQSASFPTAQPLQRVLKGPTDAVVAKLPRQLNRLIWSTYLGGSGAESAFSVQLTPDRHVYVAGGTASNDFPTVAGALRTQSAGGRDGFVACITPDGSALRQGTYLGTTANELAYFLQLDNSGDVYILGQTSSSAYPITPGKYGTLGAHQFIHKLSATLDKTEYSTTFGSTQFGYDISPTAFLVDDCERIYVSGWGGAVNENYGGGNTRLLPTTPDALQRTTDGSDFYLAQFRSGLTGLEYATFYGEQGGSGEHVDGGTSRFDKRGVVYQAVCGGCGGTQGFPTPRGANFYTTTNGSPKCNNAAFAITFGITVADPGPTRYICVGSSPVVLGGQPAGGTWTGPGVTRLSNGTYQFEPSASLVGRNVLQYTVATTGICTSTRPLRMIVTPPLQMNIAAVAPMCADGAAVTLQATPAGGTWSPVKGLSGNVFNPQQAGPGTYTLTYSYADTLGCGTTTRQVTVTPSPQPTAGPNLTFCAYETQTLQLTGATPAGGIWSGPGVTADGRFTPPDTKLRGGIFTLRYTVTQNGCSASATRQIVLAPSPSVNFPLSVPACSAAPQYTGLAPFTCSFEPVLTGGTYEWDFGDGSPISTEERPSHLYSAAGTYNVKLTARYSNCTVETSFAPVIVGDVFVPNIITPNQDTKNDTFVPRFSCQPATLRVFTRWGNKVYETENYRNDWQADNLPAGTYYYHLKDADGRTVKGWVTVQR